MSRTKNPTDAALSAPVSNGSVTQADVLTLSEAADYLRLPAEEVLRLVEEQNLPARRAGKEWRFLKAAIQEWLSTPPHRSNKEAWLALAGVWKEDPLVEGELEEIYKRRARPMIEDAR